MLEKAAKKRGVDVEVVQITPKLDIETQAKSLGDVIIYRSTFLDHEIGRPALGLYLSNRIVINDTVFRFAHTPQKFYQQNKLSNCGTTKRYTIPTYLVKTGRTPAEVIKHNKLKFPLILKPNQGAMGIGVELLKYKKDSKINKPVEKDTVLQPFIKNIGDWRVLVLGGVPLGAIKRVAKEGSHLNNISQGASAVVEKDSRVQSVVYNMAVKATAAMGLKFAGVDIIQNAETGKYHILETNSVPQWDGDYGFQSMTGINVADEIIDYAISLYERRNVKSPKRLVEENYKKNIIHFPSDAFHFTSRLWLWNGDKWAREYLDKYKERYIGLDEASTQKIVDYIFSRPTEIEPENVRSPHRLPYYKKYPELRTYIPLLFRLLFAEAIYGIDIRPYIAEKISDEDFLKLFHKLINDPDAIRVLSTHTANYFYLLKYYFKGRLSKSTATVVDPGEILDISRSYEINIERGEMDQTTAVKMKIYLLTHVIIGESRFYQRVVRLRAFRKLCEEIELTIGKSYADVTLDNKLEFLVCCKITGHKSYLRPIILNEAKASLSWAGNYLVDTLNNYADQQKGHNIRNSEHRNVLYLMARSDLKISDDTKAKAIRIEPKEIGRLMRVELPNFGVRLIARVDSGATQCSLAVSNIEENNGSLSFCIGRPSDAFYTGQVITVPEYRKQIVKTTTKSDEERYAITLNIKLKREEYTINCTLANRSHMLYPMLIGRALLRGRFVVNTAKQFV